MSGCPSTCCEGAIDAKAIISGTIVIECSDAMLKEIGYGIHMDSEGAEALFYLKRSPCNLLLTDYEMPVINSLPIGSNYQIPVY